MRSLLFVEVELMETILVKFGRHIIPEVSLLFVEVELMETLIIFINQNTIPIVASIRRSGINGNYKRY